GGKVLGGAGGDVARRRGFGALAAREVEGGDDAHEDQEGNQLEGHGERVVLGVLEQHGGDGGQLAEAGLGGRGGGDLGGGGVDQGDGEGAHGDEQGQHDERGAEPAAL